MKLSSMIAVGAIVACYALAGCNAGKEKSAFTISTGGDPTHGKQVIQGYGCGACHMIPGIRDARGLVGPPLMYFGQRTMIAGELPNTPENLVKWLRNPQSVEPHTAMPDLGLSESQARDIAAYLYTLHGSEGGSWSE